MLPIWRLQHLVAPGPALAVLTPAELPAGLPDAPLWLGLRDHRPWFAVDLAGLDEAAAGQLAGNRGRFAELRAVGADLAPEDASLLMYARGMVEWHTRQRHCPACGAPTRAEQGGHLRRCSSAACGTDHFPRTDPAVIVLVTYGDRCLLASPAGRPPELYSTLAGFIEPGETPEEAVVREVAEETGIVVEDVRYHSAQPWPFPASLMLGFTARARSTALELDPDELQDARWFTRAELRAAAAGGPIRLSSPLSIARRLIDQWLEL